MQCCKCQNEATVQSKSQIFWYCEKHAACKRCGTAVDHFVLYYLKIYVCSCVIEADERIQQEADEKIFGSFA